MKRGIGDDWGQFLHDFQTEEVEGELTDDQIADFEARFFDLRDTVEEVAECDHENVVAAIPPKYVEEPCLAQSMETGTVAVFHGQCEDCGASIDTSLEITADTGGDADE